MRIVMTAFTIVTLTCGALFSLTAHQREQEQLNMSQSSDQPQAQNKTIIAIIQNVESFKRSITVLDTWDKATVFDLGNARIYTSSTDHEEFATINDLRAGQRVQVTYSGPPDKPDNIKVIILPHGIQHY